MPGANRMCLLCVMVLFLMPFPVGALAAVKAPGGHYDTSLLYDYARAGSPEQLEKYVEQYQKDILPSHYAFALDFALDAANSLDRITHVALLLKKGAPLDLALPLKKGVPLDIVRCFLEAGAPVRPEKGLSPLYSLDPANPQAVELLATMLQAGADPNAPPEPGQSTLLARMITNDVPLALVDLLLKAGANPNPDSKTVLQAPLTVAAMRTRVDICTLLLNAGADPNNGNPMGRAVANNSIELVDLLFSHGAQAQGETGGDLLLVAARKASPAIIGRLLDAGAATDTQNENGNTALDIAEAREDIEGTQISAMLQKAGMPSAIKIRNALYLAAQEGSSEEVAAIVRGNTRFIRPFELKEALLRAVFASRQRDRQNVVDWLLAQGATVSPRSVLDACAPATILHSVLRSGGMQAGTIDTVPALFWVHWDKDHAAGLAKVLIDAGADPNASGPAKGLPLFMDMIRGTPAALIFMPFARMANDTDISQRPLVYAVVKGQKDTIEVLLDKGAQISAKDKFGFDALFYAVSSGRTDNAVLLLQKGANPGGQGVLEAAVLSDPGLVRILLGHGANAGSEEGFRALCRAVREGAPETVGILIQAEADVRRKDSTGKSLLELAQGRKHLFRQTPEGAEIESLLRAALLP